MRIIKVPVEDGVLTGYLRDTQEFEKERLRPAVVICPGGSYAECSGREGEPYALRFLTMGYQAFVLDYSVAPVRFPAALLELARAVALVREKADQWQIDPEQIFVCGSSAGGHLAGSLGVHWDKKFVQEGSGRSGEKIRPDGLILCYPVITAGEYAHEGSVKNLLGERRVDRELLDLISLEKQAGSQVPPTFLWHTAGDRTVGAENSLLFAMALKRAGVAVELHLFSGGRHAMALGDEDTALDPEGEYADPGVAEWTRLAGLWVKRLRKNGGQAGISRA